MLEAKKGQSTAALLASKAAHSAQTAQLHSRQLQGPADCIDAGIGTHASSADGPEAHLQSASLATDPLHRIGQVAAEGSTGTQAATLTHVDMADLPQPGASAFGSRHVPAQESGTSADAQDGVQNPQSPQQRASRRTHDIADALREAAGQRRGSRAAVAGGGSISDHDSNGQDGDGISEGRHRGSWQSERETLGQQPTLHHH